MALRAICSSQAIKIIKTKLLNLLKITLKQILKRII